MLPLRARVDLGAMARKGYSAFPKAPALLALHHQIVYLIYRILFGESYPSAEMQLYSTAPGNGLTLVKGKDVSANSNYKKKKKKDEKSHKFK